MTLNLLATALAMGPAPTAQAGQPLSTDDPGTQGAGAGSVDLVGSVGDALSVSVTGTLGITGEIDLAIGATAGEPATVAGSLKWRAVQADDVSFGVRADVQLDTTGMFACGALLFEARGPLALRINLAPRVLVAESSVSWALAALVATELSWECVSFVAEAWIDLGATGSATPSVLVGLAWAASEAHTLGVGLNVTMEPQGARWSSVLAWTLGFDAAE